MIFVLLFLGCIFAASFKGIAKDQVTICKGNTTRLVDQKDLATALTLNDTILGPCELHFPDMELSVLCFPGNGYACNDTRCVGISIPCYEQDRSTLGIGVCDHGLMTCVETGMLSECTGAVYPSDELCSEHDENCNNIINDGWDAGEPCSIVHGACTSEGKKVCSADGKSTYCDAKEIFPKEEDCWNGIDDDCNDKIDCDDPVCIGSKKPCYEGPEGTADVGECRSGFMECLPNGVVSSCKNQTFPTRETCNNKDDDCNRIIDDNIVAIVPDLETCHNGKIVGCFVRHAHDSYMNMMGRMMNTPMYNTARDLALRESDEGRDSIKFNSIMVQQVLAFWLGEVRKPGEMVTHLDARASMGENVVVQNLSPVTPCALWKDVSFTVVITEAVHKLHAGSVRDVLAEMQLFAEFLDGRCLHDFCPDGTTFKTCGSDDIFGSNCHE